MIVNANDRRVDQVASGATPTFNYDFAILADTDIAAYWNGVAVATLGVTFTVIGAGGESGGSVTFSLTPINGTLVTLIGVEEASQPSRYQNVQSLPLSQMENDYSRATILIQQLQEILGRAVTWKVGSLKRGALADDPIAGQLLRYKNSNGDIDSVSSFVTGGAIALPLTLGNGGTGINAASLSALMKTFGVRLNAGPAGNTSLSPSAGAVVVPNPLTTGIWSVQGGNFSSLSASPGALDVGSEFVFYYSAGGNVITPSGTLFPHGGVAWTTSAGDMSLFRYVGGAQFVEVERIYAGQYNGTLAASQSPLFLRADGAFVQAAVVYMNGIIGLTIANNAGDATNDIDIALGSVLSDAANPALKEPMYLASGLTKQLDAAWAVGTNQGMRCTGVSLADGTYHIFVAKRMDTGVVDVFADSSATGSNVVATNANYTKKQRIASIVRTGGAIKAFIQFGDTFWWKDSVLDVNATNPGTSAVTRTLTVPLGISVLSLLNVVVDNDTTANVVAYLSALSVTDVAASLTAAPLGTVTAGSTASSGYGGQAQVLTDNSGQIRSRLSASGAADILRIATMGWSDPLRGKN